ncbi:hypothetical protein V5O48_011937 [Marasmius crinis-equi]|uniref:Large ribosomal subunit protein bL28c n=1 Tax=Marasmius crinis-equi TaxID=585013 RepID=A0ABR3F467_9AGAR
MIPTLPTLKATPASQPFKRAQLGLFQGKLKRYGNNVPFSHHKTRRTWLPNVQRKRLPSEALGTNIRVKLTTRALKSIKKHNGIDNYLLNTRHEMLGWEGLRLRVLVRDAMENPPPPKGETPEAKAVREEKEELTRRKAKATQARASELRRVVHSQKPTLKTAQAARQAAIEALGGTASPGKIIEYLRKQKQDQKELLGTSFAKMSIS